MTYYSKLNESLRPGIGRDRESMAGANEFGKTEVSHIIFVLSIKKG